MNGIPDPESLPVAVRAYAEPPRNRRRNKGTPKRKDLGPSEWTLIFDTETTTDSAQQLRFGAYQVRRSGELWEAGFFHDPHDPLSSRSAELATLRAYAESHDLEVRTLQEFVEEVFFPYAYDLRGTCVGLNLPFDLSRIAIDHGSARRRMRGGFSFKLSKDKRRPRVRIKHLNNRSSLIDFSAPPKQFTPRGMRKGQRKVPTRRGYLVDVRTLAGALLGGSWSLGRLGEHLEIEHQKLGTEEHGGPLTAEYLEYAVRDVQATWECYEQLKKQYESYGLTQTPLHKIYSEASLGKAYLKQMNIRPWRELQPDFPPKLLGSIMSSYYGGRSEVRIRREVTQVLYCDFLSMYPTVCTLMDLWGLVVAERMTWRRATAEVRSFLGNVTIEDLRNPECWKQLRVLVKVQPDGDVFPVRARYEDGDQHTIGLNHLSSEQSIWFTLADCVASKFLTGRTPVVLEALRFELVGTQADLAPIDIAGNPDYRVDPHTDDLYRRVIDLRSEVKERREEARESRNESEVAKLDAEQKALKLLANATSYGIFVELNVSAQATAQEMVCYGGEDAFNVRVRNMEEPGRYFHPLLATLITGAARLMLAIAERLAEDSGITWAFCDTDSMALARPKGMKPKDFLERAGGVREWFTTLNPYEKKEGLFKLEDANYQLEDDKLTDEIEPLYVLAVSAKRYALYNLDEQGRPLLRKISAHGLGHLLPPYGEYQATSAIPEPIVSLTELEAERWQHDLWYRIIVAALGDTPEQVNLDDLPGFDRPAVSRYTAATPKLLRWFDRHNEEKPYGERVRPFGFLLAYQVNMLPFSGEDFPRPVSAYDSDLGKAAEGCLDRETGRPVPRDQLKSYWDALAQYHLHPESKFHNGDYTDRGFTRRRHIRALATEYIGKEANRWEEQFHLGLDLEAQTEYGISPEGRDRTLEALTRASKKFGQRELARAADISLSEVSAVLLGKRAPRSATLSKLYGAASCLEREAREGDARIREVLEAVRERCECSSVRQFAKQAKVDTANLTHVLSGRRKPSRVMLMKLRKALGEYR
jgi:transcriptional regulator with XRE-family HTH domain